MDVTLHLLYDEEVFGKTLQAGLLTGGSSYLLRLPLTKRLRVVLQRSSPITAAVPFPFLQLNTVKPQIFTDYTEKI